MKPLGLPIDAVLDDLRRALSENANVVLEALPGVGKTTGIPLVLLDAPWLAGKKMLVLAWAYPDRIGQLRTGFKGEFLLSSGRGAYLDETSPLASEPYLVAKALRRWQGRVSFLRRLLTEDDPWPDVSDEGLEPKLNEWLGPYLVHMDRLSGLARMDLKSALFGMLSYQQKKSRRANIIQEKHIVITK